MNYIGSKLRLLPVIKRFLAKQKIPITGEILDLFSGTSAVSQLFKSLGYSVLSNDWQAYASFLAKALVGLSAFPEFKGLTERGYRSQLKLCHTSAVSKKGKLTGASANVLAYLNELSGSEGSFFHAYCEGGDSGRLYFSSENGKRIQSIRDCIESWYNQSLISEGEYAWLVATLIESADRVANTASVYGAFLKQLKPVAQKPLQLIGLNPVKSPLPVTVYCEDSLALLTHISWDNIQMTYLDPPYNHRQYGGNYHMLETLARWDLDGFVPRGVAGLRALKEKNSSFSSRKLAVRSFETLFSRVKSHYILFSYSNEGLLNEKQIRYLLNTYCKDVVFHRISYHRFRADRDHEKRRYQAGKTQEFLIFARMKASLYARGEGMLV